MDQAKNYSEYEFNTELKENQLAITSGLKDIVELSRDILKLKLNKELPFLGAIDEEERLEIWLINHYQNYLNQKKKQ